MRIAIDATVLAFAVNRYTPEHPRAAQLVESLVNGDVPWALPWPAVHAFLSYVTHPHAVVRPLRPAEALGFLDQVLASPAVHTLSPTDDHAATLAEIAERIEGSTLPAGYEVAAVLREHGVRELLSTDRGMRRFPFLEVINPLRGSGWSPERRPARRYRVLRRTASPSRVGRRPGKDERR